MNNITNNVKSIGAELVASAKTDKARDFAAGLTQKVLAKGDKWIEANVAALAAIAPAEGMYCSVTDNRLFFCSKWQMALLDK